MRGTHHRERDHHGFDRTKWAVLDEAIGTYSSGTNLQDFLEGLAATVSSGIGGVTGGEATISSGFTAVAVGHGAGFAPSIFDVHINPTNNPTNDPGWFWLSEVSSTSFVINVRSDPGAGGATFSWRVDR